MLQIACNPEVWGGEGGAYHWRGMGTSVPAITMSSVRGKRSGRGGRKEGRRGGRRQEGVTVAPLLKSKDLHAPWLQVSEKINVEAKVPPRLSIQVM